MSHLKFHVVSAGQPDEDYIEKNFKRIIEKKAFVLHENTNQKGSYFDISTGDILILKYHRNFVAYGKVKNRFINNEDGFNHWASVEEWIFKDDKDFTDGTPRYGIDKATEAGGKYGTVKTISTKFAVQKIKEINQIHPLYNFIVNSSNKENNQMEIENIINVLEHKKQIILQGPPGTGKTYSAEAIAKQLTEVETFSNPKEMLDEFYKNFNRENKEVVNYRIERKKLREQFLDEFPKENLKELSLENYCIGTGERDNFCWWIERGLKILGYYFPGSSLSYRLYWSKSKDEYVKSGFVKDITDESEAMKAIAEAIYNLVESKNYNEAKKYFGESYILKILNTYYPEEYAPINAANYIKNALSLFSIELGNLNFVQLNQRLLALHQQKNIEFNTDVEPHEFMRFLFENFNIKEGEKLDANQVVTKGAFELVQFHPAYSYEDFVRGIVAEVIDKQPMFSVKNKILAKFAEKAIDNPKAKFVLIIDEINRANLPAVLGELIYALEYRGKTINSLYEYEGERKIKLPNNLYIIGTMNTADRSVGHIDYAIRRRFSFIDVLPNEMYVPDFAKDKFQSVSNLFEKEFLSSEFKRDDVQIGHSYFMANTIEELEIKIKFEVVPILKEYVKDGVLTEDAILEIEKL
ncbi:5-methylcytosine-specific restriction protein B [Maribacter caenipelagi]|uniref:5-methylcytosine-specific restriction protein B n=1 Tax=Maribacter caenipelagi TaxID=1447781 RepID=A0A4R7D3W2_9FLAO|nr:AAA family ATPase [Maribacter caenipelagi]TDS13546.1 5-methylcytosine-specific restriction protein B [Maribacter caenipelagi]